MMANIQINHRKIFWMIFSRMKYTRISLDQINIFEKSFSMKIYDVAT